MYLLTVRRQLVISSPVCLTYFRSQHCESVYSDVSRFFVSRSSKLLGICMPLLGSWYRECICLGIPIHLPVLGSKNLRFIASTVLVSLLVLRHTRAPFFFEYSRVYCSTWSRSRSDYTDNSHLCALSSLKSVTCILTVHWQLVIPSLVCPLYIRSQHFVSIYSDVSRFFVSRAS